jgi:hypothetical protein
MFGALHHAVQIVIENLSMVVILGQIIFFSQLKIESIVGALQDLVETGGWSA